MALPGRSIIAEGSLFLDNDTEWRSLSLTPDRTRLALAALIVPLAAMLLIYRIGWRKSTKVLPWIIAGLGAASAGFGLAQVFDGGESSLYFYEFTSRGLPVGFFSNVNHQASLCLMSLPFTAAIAGNAIAQGRSGDGVVGRMIVLGAIGLMQIVGVLAAGSVAGYIMLVPVALLSGAILRPSKSEGRGRMAGVIVAVFALSAATVASSPMLSGLGTTSFDNDSDMSRRGIYETALRGIEDHGLLGAGFGSFETVFKLYEDPSIVSATYAVHAHNDYLQTWFELGILGLAIILVLLVWWCWKFVQVWTMKRDDTVRLRRAASLALMVIALHSLVDYPLRTIALSALAGTCLALMIVDRRTAPAPSGHPSDKPAHNSVSI
ncbi:MAG: O-antigen ligase family protein [Pseudomonadota bacterium]